MSRVWCARRSRERAVVTESAGGCIQRYASRGAERSDLQRKREKGSEWTGRGGGPTRFSRRHTTLFDDSTCLIHFAAGAREKKEKKKERDSLFGLTAAARIERQHKEDTRP